MTEKKEKEKKVIFNRSVQRVYVAKCEDCKVISCQNIVRFEMLNLTCASILYILNTIPTGKQ